MKNQDKMNKIIILLIWLMLFSVIYIVYKSDKKIINEIDKTENIEKEIDKVIIISKNETFILYKNKMCLKLKNDIYLSKDKAINSIISKKNYDEIVNELNYILPVKIEEYNYDINHTNNDAIEIPVIELDGKKYINTYLLASIFEVNYFNISYDKNKNKIIDILNGNGRSGSANTIGKKISENLGYKYNAANYDEVSRYSYIINNSLQESEIVELIELLDEKYIKIKTDYIVPTIADAVIILGREVGFLTQIVVQSNTKLNSKEYLTLKNNYRNTKQIKIKTNIEEKSIEYNPVDYYIALKISKLIGIDNMVENVKLNERININLNE